MSGINKIYRTTNEKEIISSPFYRSLDEMHCEEQRYIITSGTDYLTVYETCNTITTSHLSDKTLHKVEKELNRRAKHAALSSDSTQTLRNNCIRHKHGRFKSVKPYRYAQQQNKTRKKRS